MTALVIGASGQLGKALVRHAPRDVTVVGWSRADLDLADIDSVSSHIEALRPTVVLNAAAYTAVDRAESEADLAFRINRDAARAIATGVARINARMIHVSTDFVFDGTASSPYQPEAAHAPLGVYGISKSAGEDAVLSALPNALIVRTAWLYGARGQNFVETMLRLMSERDRISVVADQIGTPTHANSLARALWALAPLDLCGAHHFTDAGVASWYDFAEAIYQTGRSYGILTKPVSVVPIATAEYPTPARRPAYSVLDKSSTWRALGAPAMHWQTELKHMLAGRKSLDVG